MISKENLEIYVKANILREYDLSANAREQHDIEMVYNKEGKKIKATREEILKYWSDILIKDRELKEVK